jgi:hypothetical protein
MSKISGFKTSPKNGQANWLVVVKNNDQIEKMFYMAQDGQFHRSIDTINFKKEYEFAKNWKHTVEKELDFESLSFAKKCLTALENLKPGTVTYNPFAGLAEKIK